MRGPTLLVAAVSAVIMVSPAAAARRPVVVLDPGHGGPHPGTRSRAGDEEKVLALAIAVAAKSVLQRRGVDVRLTRSDDRHVPLGARPAFAAAVGAELFVSIHLNHAPDPERRGWESYVMSAQASDALTRRILAFEEGDIGGRRRRSEGTASTDLAFILGDLSRGVAHERSARLARTIQDAVRGFEGLSPSRGLRQAPFTVLTGARVPAVLVEVGYLSNATQARFLSSPRGQQQAGQALARGILVYLRGR